jgi:zinc transporter ZupT
MTTKQAVLYNCLSSLLSLVGMVVGLAVGNIGHSSPWIFAGIGGMFLHISLVDLVSTADKTAIQFNRLTIASLMWGGKLSKR